MVVPFPDERGTLLHNWSICGIIFFATPVSSCRYSTAIVMPIVMQGVEAQSMRDDCCSVSGLRTLGDRFRQDLQKCSSSDSTWTLIC